MSELLERDGWEERWAGLGEAERWCVDFATLLGPDAVPAEWVYLLTRRMRGTAVKAVLTIRNHEAEAIDYLVEAGWMSWPSDGTDLVQMHTDAGDWRADRLAESSGREAVCENAVSLLAIERARAIRKAPAEQADRSEALCLLALARKLADWARVTVALEVAAGVAAAAHEAGRGEDAERLLADLLARVPEGEYRFRHVSSLLELGRLQYKRAAYDEARQTFERAITLAEQKTNPASDTVAVAHCELGKVLCGLDELADADREIRLSIALLRRKYPPDHARLGVPYHELACVLMKQLRRDQAVEYFERAIETQTQTAEDGKLVAESYLGIATAHLKVKDHRAALAPAERALELRLRRLPADHGKVTVFYDLVAIASSGVGEHDRAIECRKIVLDAKVRRLGPDHADTLGTRTLLAKGYEATRDFPAALECWQTIVAIRTRAHADDAKLLAVAKNNLAVSLNRFYRHEEALAQLEEAMAIYDRIMDVNDPGRVGALLNSAVTLRKLNRFERAVALASEALRILRWQSPPDERRISQATSLVTNLTQRLGG